MTMSVSVAATSTFALAPPCKISSLFWPCARHRLCQRQARNQYCDASTHAGNGRLRGEVHRSQENMHKVSGVRFLSCYLHVAALHGTFCVSKLENPGGGCFVFVSIRCVHVGECTTIQRTKILSGLLGESWFLLISFR